MESDRHAKENVNSTDDNLDEIRKEIREIRRLLAVTGSKLSRLPSSDWAMGMVACLSALIAIILMLACILIYFGTGAAVD